MILGAHERGLGDWGFPHLRLVLPVGPHLEDFNAVADEPVAEIEFLTNVKRGTTTFHELRKRFFAALDFDFGEGHVRAGAGCVYLGWWPACYRSFQ